MKPKNKVAFYLSRSNLVDRDKYNLVYNKLNKLGDVFLAPQKYSDENIRKSDILIVIAHMDAYNRSPDDNDLKVDFGWGIDKETALALELKIPVYLYYPEGECFIELNKNTCDYQKYSSLISDVKTKYSFFYIEFKNATVIKLKQIENIVALFKHPIKKIPVTPINSPKDKIKKDSPFRKKFLDK